MNYIYDIKNSLNIPKNDKPRIVVVGGGFGGLNFLKNISLKEFQVVLLDRFNYHTFQPLLYQVATAGLEPDSIAGPLRKIIHKNKNVYFRMVKVNEVVPDLQIIKTSLGSLHYDYLVIATGAQVNFYGNKSIARHAFPLKQVTHALDLRSHIFQQFEKMEINRDQSLENMNFVIVGAGPTGVELSGALAELRKHVLPKDYPELNFKKMNIYLIEGLDRVLPTMSKKVGEKVQQYLDNYGIITKLNCMTKAYDGKTVELSDGNKIKTGTLIWAAGVKGNLLNGFNEDSILKGKYLVNEYNQVIKQEGKAYKRVFAIGDVSYMKTETYPDGLPGLAQIAIQQGKNLAENMNRITQYKLIRKFRYKNKGVLAAIGRNKAVADLPMNIRLYGFLGWVVWMTVHLLFLIGFRNKAITLANWMWNYFTYDKGIRLILRPSSKKNDTMSREMIHEMQESNY